MEELISRLQAAASGAELNLGELLADVGDAPSLVGAMPVPLTIRGATVAVGTGSVGVRGVVSWLGLDAAFALDLAETERCGPALRALSVTLEPTAELAFPGLPWFALRGVAVGYDRSSGASSSTLSGVVRVGETDVPFALALPLPEGDVVLGLAGDDPLDLPGLDAVAGLLGGGAVLGALKDGLSAASSLGLKRLDLTLASAGLRAVDLELESGASLPIVPDALILTGLGAAVRIEAPLDEEARSWSGAVWGSMEIAGASVGVRLGREEGAAAWTLGLDGVSELSLPSLGAVLSGVGLPGDLLPEGLSSLAVTLSDLHADLDPFSGEIWSLNLSIGVASSWSLLGLDVRSLGLALRIGLPASSARTVAARLAGDLAFAGAQFHLEAIRAAHGWSVSAALAADQTLSLAAVVQALSPVDLGLPGDLVSLPMRAAEVSIDPATGGIRLYGQINGSWSLPVGPSGLELNELVVKVERTHHGAAVTVNLKAEASLGGGSFSVRARLGEGWSVTATAPEVQLGQAIEALASASQTAGLNVPSGVLPLTLSDVTLEASASAVSLRGSSGTFPLVAVDFARGSGGDWDAIAGLVADGEASPSALWSGLAALDGLDLSGSLVVVSTSAAAGERFSDVPALKDEVINRGVALHARLGLDALGVGQIIGVDHVGVVAVIGGGGSIQLAAALAGDIRLSDAVVLRESTLGVTVAPEMTSVALATTVAVEIQQPPLLFTGALNVSPAGGSFAASMEGDWEEPFGLSGVTVSDLALELGISSAAVPTVGLAGSLRVGSETGALAVRFDSTNPGRSMLVVAFSRLRPLDLVAQLCDAAVGGALPGALRSLAEQVSLVDCELYVVPVQTTIGGVTYAAGTRVKGGIEIGGLAGRASVEVQPAGGARIRGSLDPIHWFDVVSVTAASGSGGPSLEMDLVPSGRTTGKLNGKVGLLGWEQSADIEVSASERRFHLTGATPVTRYDLQVVHGSALSATGTVNLQVVGDIGPFEFSVKSIPVVGGLVHALSSASPLGGPTFETITVPNIHLDFWFEGAFSLEASATRQHLSISGSVRWEGSTLSMPALSFTVLPRDLERLPSLLLSHISDHAEAIFGSLFDQVYDLAMMGVAAVQDLALTAFSETSAFVSAVGEEVARLGQEAAAALSNAAAEVARLGSEAAAAVADLGHRAEEVALRSAEVVSRIGAIAAANVASVVNSATVEVTRLANIGQQALSDAAQQVAAIAAAAVAEVQAILNQAAEAAAAVIAAAEDAARLVVEAAEALVEEAEAMLDEAQDMANELAEEISNADEINRGSADHRLEALGRLAYKCGGIVVGGMVRINGVALTGLSKQGNAMVGKIEYLGGVALGEAEPLVDLVTPLVPSIPGVDPGSWLPFSLPSL